ncbi:MAG: M14 family zinc carboxypeptidase [Cytophagales bacterium]|nr:M14 family zinc carboxypeptidase [Cytophagales bacterium]
MRKILLTSAFSLLALLTIAQDYFYGGKGPFDSNIPSPEAFLGYPIGEHHTRHDRIVAYFEKLAELSPKATIHQYGMTHEYRPLVILTITSEANHNNLEELKQKHLDVVNTNTTVDDFSDIPAFINLGYNVHGNEPSSSEAAMLTAYTLLASQSDEVKQFLDQGVIMIDPTINPDGRDRHTHWANMHKGTPMVADPNDVEHNESWPRGRTNHYWFDLNRDWWLAINPESRGKLNWYHQWYPNVVTDFHEMGTNSTYFFEPMKDNASKNPIMPKENYTTLNDLFAKYYQEDLNKIGSFYFTKEVFDGTYPGYGSSYPDLQGGLALLFEQASSRGHKQNTPTGEITFAFTIRNQYTSSMATVRASVENKDLLHDYQQRFFKSALSNARSSRTKSYVFTGGEDAGRTKAFIDKLLIHRVKVYKTNSDITSASKSFKQGQSYIVPTNQPQYRMVQSAFETYKEFKDSVYYDASAWSIANFYNMTYAAMTTASLGEEVTNNTIWDTVSDFPKSDYAYLIPWKDYNAMPLLNDLQQQKIVTFSGFKPFSINTHDGNRTFDYGTLMIPVSKQNATSEDLHRNLINLANKHGVQIYATDGGYSSTGIDLGSRHFRPLRQPKPLMLIGDGIYSYEAGEVWHLLDQRMGMPITKVRMNRFGSINWDNYNTLVLTSGSYSQLDSVDIQNIKNWISKGNTLITFRTATQWAINKGLVNEKLIKEEKKDKNGEVKRMPYIDAPENRGKNSVGGAIFEVNLDLTHPVAFGYSKENIPVYRNSTVWLAPSKNPYATVAKYTTNPHIDGFVTKKNLDQFVKPGASIVVSNIGGGRAILFAENPNFRGSWYGTNKLFMNAMFLGNHISVPRE